MTPQALIEALERAEGPDRELDAEIAEALEPDQSLAAKVRRASRWPVRDDCLKALPKKPPADTPHYTRSLDAAMTLVPAQLGIMWDVAKYPGGEAAAYVGQKDAPVRSFVIAATPAIAFCIAALKAREKETE